MEMTNTRRNPLDLKNILFDKLFAGYALDPWFKDPVNLAKLVLHHAIWWCLEGIVVPDVGSLCKDILFE